MSDREYVERATCPAYPTPHQHIVLTKNEFCCASGLLLLDPFEKKPGEQKK